jgi:hypothetical protein
MKYIVPLVFVLLSVSCDRQLGDTGTGSFPTPGPAAGTSTTGYAEYLGTIDTVLVTHRRNKPHHTEILTVYIEGTWSVNVAEIQSSSSTSGGVVTINLYVTSGLLQFVSNWNYSYGIGPLPRGSYYFYVNLIDAASGQTVATAGQPGIQVK